MNVYLVEWVATDEKEVFSDLETILEVHWEFSLQLNNDDEYALLSRSGNTCAIVTERTMYSRVKLG